MWSSEATLNLGCVNRSGMSEKKDIEFHTPLCARPTLDVLDSGLSDLLKVCVHRGASEITKGFKTMSSLAAKAAMDWESGGLPLSPESVTCQLVTLG